jgi:hypothetical protein
MKIVAVLSCTAILAACSKGEPPAAPAAKTGAALSAPAAAGPAGAPHIPTRADREAELQKILAEVPAKSAGAESAEAVARAFVLAAARGDDAGMKNQILSVADIESLVEPKRHNRAKRGVARSLAKARRKPLGAVEILEFEPGEVKTIQAGDRGFTQAATLMTRARLKVKVGGKDTRLRFRTLVKVGDRWKIADL